MAAIKPDLEETLRRSHARIYRIAWALCGDRRAADLVVKKVILQSAAAARRWANDEDAQRWLMHYALLLSRMAKPPARDALLDVAENPESIAIIEALRELPMQQREAFLLHHGQQMELRQLATAMDCSTTAAANHLVAAVTALRSANLIGIGDFTRHLSEMLARLMPPAEQLERQLEQTIHLQQRRQARGTLLICLQWLMVLAIIAWVLGWICTHVEFVGSSTS